MKLKARILGNDYDIVQGASFSEEYNETLDSGAIIISQVGEITGLKQYDDVFIYDAEQGDFEGAGYAEVPYSGDPFPMPENGLRIDGDSLIANEEFLQNCFAFYVNYFKMTVEFKLPDGSIAAAVYEPDSFVLSQRAVFKNITGDQQLGDLAFSFNNMLGIYQTAGRYDVSAYYIDFGSKIPYKRPTRTGFYKHLLVNNAVRNRLGLSTGLYQYTINLFSETKGLEKKILPNISITQPTGDYPKKSVWDKLKYYVSTYSPKVKVGFGGVWGYVRKYTLDPSLESIYASTNAPEMTINTPSLRDVVSQLMLTKDMIPVVKDGVITALDITKRTQEFDYDPNCITGDTSAIASDDYAEILKRPYNEAISQDNTCRRVEYLGFRNSDEGLLTIANMRLETAFPIYRINKVLMCYYKKVTITQGSSKTNKAVLIKQDITPLVLLNQTRDVLSLDWNDFSEDKPVSIEDAAKYKLCTVGYDIGSRYIRGWGTKYSYPRGWWDVTRTYLENMALLIDSINPTGIYSENFLGSLGEGTYAAYSALPGGMISPYGNSGSLWLKGFVFEVDYNAFYSGVTATSKQGAGDQIETLDKQSASLSLLEKDGLYQKEKADRYGNEGRTISARYEDISDMQPLGSYLDDDVIIYHREYSIYSNLVLASYQGTKDYVLKNYYTSVYAQLRPYNYLSYDNTIRRAELKHADVIVSKDELVNMPVEGIRVSTPSKLLSAFTPSDRPQAIGYEVKPSAITYGFFAQTHETGFDLYSSDVNTFVNGHSLCIDVAMPDNISYGNYIKQAVPSFSGSATEDDLTGSVQGWYKAISDSGYMDGNVATSFLSAGDAPTFPDVCQSEATALSYSQQMLDLPKISNILAKFRTPEISLYLTNYQKDNKEVLDITTQFEFLSGGDHVAMSEWFAKLCDYSGTYQKNDVDYEVSDPAEDISDVYVFPFAASYDVRFTMQGAPQIDYAGAPKLLIQFPASVFDGSASLDAYVGARISGDMVWPDLFENSAPWFRQNIATTNFGVHRMTLNNVSITYFDEDTITIHATQSLRVWHSNVAWVSEENYSSEVDYTLHRVSRIHADRNGVEGDLQPDEGVVWFYSGKPNASGVAQLYDDDPFFKAPTSDGRIYNKPTSAAVTSENKTTYGVYASYSASYHYHFRGFDGDLSSVGDKKYIQSRFSDPQTYKKNMFVAFSDDPIKKTLVYETPSDPPAGLRDDVQVANVFSVGDNGIISINLAEASRTTSSVQYWYLYEGQYHFVVGFDIRTSLVPYIDYAYYSLTSSQDKKVYAPDRSVAGEVKNLSDSGVYEDTPKEYD